MKLSMAPMNSKQKKGIKITLVVGLGIMGILIIANIIQAIG